LIIKKTPEEIERMAAAGAILVRTLDLLAGKIRPGVTTRELDQAAERFIRSQGAEPAFKGYRGFPGSICSSPQTTSTPSCLPSARARCSSSISRNSSRLVPSRPP